MLANELKIKEFIERNYLVSFGVDLTESTDMFDAGIIDSFGFIELVSFMEKEYGLKISNEQIMNDELSSYEKLCRLVIEFEKP